MNRLVTLSLAALLLVVSPLVAQGGAETVAQARAEAAAGDRAEAMRLLQGHLAAAPDDLVARTLYAQLLLKTKQYDRARRELRLVLERDPGNVQATATMVRVDAASGHPSRAERIAAQAREKHPDDVDLLLAHAQALRALNRKPDAQTLVLKAVALDENNEDALRMRRLLQAELQSSQVSLQTNFDHFSDHRESWMESQLAAQRNTTFGPVIGRVSHVNRFGESDNLVELEGFPRFRSTSAYIGVGFATDATLYPKSRFAAELFQGVGLFEGSLGVRRLNFNGPINIYTASISRYQRDWFFSIRGQHTAGVQGINAFQLVARKFFADGTQYVGMRLGKGSSRDEIRSANDLEALDTRDVTAEGLFQLREHWLLNVKAGYGRDAVHDVRRGSLSAGLGYRFGG